MTRRDFHDNLITANDKIIDTLRIIDGHGVPIGLVHDNGRLIGTVTDGDIRRGLLAGLSLDAPVGTVMNKKPIRLVQGTPDADIRVIMRERSILYVPIVDENDNIVDLKIQKDMLGAAASVLDDDAGEDRRYTGAKDNVAVIMAGGEGRRLRPLTENLPKPMVEVGGKPILESIIERFVRQGFTQLYISVNYRKEVIESYFGDGAKWGARITYIYEDTPRGTAGALALLPPNLTQKPLVVMNGDLVTKVNFEHLIDFHTSHRAPATMAVWEFQSAVPYGVVSTDDVYLSGIEEKPVMSYLVNAGIYVVEPHVLSRIPNAISFTMPELFKFLLEAAVKDGSGKPAVFPLREYWIDIGNIEQLDRARRDIDET
jgi:dTDP-glucose pyrophosphorylase